MASEQKQTALASEEINDWLAVHLPSCSFADGYLTCSYITGNWRLTLLY